MMFGIIHFLTAALIQPIETQDPINKSFKVDNLASQSSESLFDSSEHRLQIQEILKDEVILARMIFDSKLFEIRQELIRLQQFIYNQVDINFSLAIEALTQSSEGIDDKIQLLLLERDKLLELIQSYFSQCEAFIEAALQGVRINPEAQIILLEKAKALIELMESQITQDFSIQGFKDLQAIGQ